MAVIVEDGTGLSDAQSYSSVAEADTYFLEHTDPLLWSEALEPAKEKALKVATQYMDAVFKLRWKGTRKLQAQALDWPRYSVEDRDGFWISESVLPRVLKEACAEYALRSMTSNLFPDLPADNGQLRAKRVKVGPIEVDKEFAGTGARLYPRYSLVEALLSDLFRPSRMVRA